MKNSSIIKIPSLKEVASTMKSSDTSRKHQRIEFSSLKSTNAMEIESLVEENFQHQSKKHEVVKYCNKKIETEMMIK